MKNPDSMQHPHGFLDDDFARFREQRLREKTQAIAAVDDLSKASERTPQLTEPDDGLFFGTSSNERRRIRAEENARRATAEVDSATKRILRKKAGDRRAS